MTGILILRPATIHDMDTLLEWRNDSTTRKASRNTAKVETDEHKSWFIKVLNDSNQKILIAEENGAPVGTVRAELSEGIWELSWTVAPNARGRGVAKRMVAKLAHEIREPIRAEVKADNTASTLIAEQAGMKFDREKNGILHYIRA